MKTYKQIKQKLAEDRQQLDEVGPALLLIPVIAAVGVAAIPAGIGFGAAAFGWRMGGGAGDMLRTIGEKSPIISSIMAAAGVSAFSIAKFFEYLDKKDKMRVKIRRKDDLEEIIIDAMDFADIPTDIVVSKSQARQLMKD